MDFSLANLTFSEDQCLHSTKAYKKCDYRDVLREICKSYQSSLNIPIFGYSAKIQSQASGPSQIFPISRDLKNPFIYNNPMNLTEVYTECVKSLELATPINLLQIFKMIKEIGMLAKEAIVHNKLENFFVFYILSSGLIDDLQDVLNTLFDDPSWSLIPIQIHVINLSGPNLNTEDLDTLRF